NLFDNIKRDYTGPALYDEPAFAFLNRSSQVRIQLVRQLLEGWFDDFPDRGKPDLRSRLRSKRDREHWGAFFELYCYCLLRRQGFMISLHPEADPTKTTRPDFLVEKNGMPAFYME